MSVQEIKDGLSQVRRGIGNVFSGCIDNCIDGLVQYKQGKPSWLRVATIPLGCLCVGVGIAVVGTVEGYQELAADFRKARKDAERARQEGEGASSDDSGGASPSGE